MRKLLRLFGMALVAIAVLSPVSVKAAGKNVCQTLKESKTYKYNLDQKGKKESIKVQVSGKSYTEGYYTKYDVKTTVTINGKEIYSKTSKDQYSDSTSVKVMVTDVDKKDKQMELLIIEGWEGTEYKDAWASNMEHIYYYQYANGKAKRKQDLVKLFKKSFINVMSLHGIKGDSYLTTNGKNEIYARICVAMQKSELDDYYDDCLHVKAGLRLKNGKFVQISSKSYTILDVAEEWDIHIILKKNLTAYIQMGGKKKAFTIKKGEMIPPGSLYCIKGKKVYFKVKNKKGKWGYMEFKKGTLYFDGIAHM